MKRILTDLPLRTYASLPEGNIEQVGVFFHGYGADGQDLFNISGVLRHFFPNAAFYFPDAPEELGFFEAPDVVVPGKSDSEVAVDVTATLGSRMSLMQLMAAASGFRAENFTLDLTCRVKVRGGIRKTVRLENVPVAELFRKVSYESI